MRVALIDNYDSFTFNVVHALGMEGATVEVWRNDAMAPEEFMALGADAIVISPGPGTPDDAGISMPVIRHAAGMDGKAGKDLVSVPLFGICLGHQAIGQVFGGNVVRATPMHGKVSRITHDGKGLFRGINGPVEVTRYHSLVVEDKGFPQDLAPTARTEDGLVMALQHRAKPIYGVQFHPESIATEQGQLICRNFLTLAREFNASKRAA